MDRRERARVLLAEDNATLALDTCRLLEQHGLECRTVYTGPDAVDAVREDEEVELVLMDVELAGAFDGDEAARRILEFRTLPIVFLSAHAEPEYLERAGSVTNYGYLLKGSGEPVLVESVRMALSLFREHQTLRLLAEHSRDVVAIYDASFAPIYISPSFYERTGYTEEDLAERGMFEMVHPEDAEALIERAKKVIAERRPHATYQFRAFTKDGELLWIESYASYLYRNDGSLDCIVATEREITERKRTEERLERAAEEMQRLMAELNHRVKNNLAMVRSHIRLKDDRLGETADLSDLDARIRAILGVHERLQNTSSVTHVPFRRYVEDLLADVFTQWSGPRVRLDIRVEDIHLPARTAVSLGLVLTELATNAMKHGFDDEELPVFSVSCSRSDGDGHCVLTVTNSGRPLPADLDMESPETLGLQLVTSSIRAHGGTIEVEGAPQPLFRIRVPVDAAPRA